MIRQVSFGQIVLDDSVTLGLRDKFINSLRVTPVVALEVARIISGIKYYVDISSGGKEIYFLVVHGDMTTLQDIRRASFQEFPEYYITASSDDIKNNIEQACVVITLGSEKEMEELGEPTHTFLLFCLKKKTIM